MTKIYLFIGLILISLLSTGASIFFFKKFQNEKEQKTNIELLYSDKIKHLETYKNSYGEVVSRNISLQLDVKTLKQLREEDKLEWLKHLEGANKRISHLEYALNIKASIIDSLRTKLNFVPSIFVTDTGDSIKFNALKWKYEDKWGKFSLNQITPDSADFKYNINLSLSPAMYWKRKTPILWIFSKKVYETEIVSDNPNTNISEITSIKIQKKH